MPGGQDAPSYRFAGRPWWIASHVFVALCVLVFVRLGIWQLNRLAERRDLNTVVAARQAEPAVPIGSLVTPEDQGAEAESAQFRQVSVSGTYRTQEQVLIGNRTNAGAPGYWVVTPLRTDAGPAVAVNRGWIPLAMGDAADTAAYAPPEGPVTVTGIVRETQRAEGLGPVDPPGRQRALARVDVARIQQQVDVPLLGVYVDLRAQDPPQPTGQPVPVPAPPLDEGSHLSYALQWFTFAGLTVVVYVVLLRRVARRRDDDDAGGTTDDDARGGADDEVPIAGGR